jgi:hypothetical protein
MRFASLLLALGFGVPLGCAATSKTSTSGAMKKMIGHLDHASVFGLAFWGGVAYGFDDGGALFQIDLGTAATTLIPMPGAPKGLSFWGAGSTTAAPLVTPK